MSMLDFAIDGKETYSSYDQFLQILFFNLF